MRNVSAREQLRRRSINRGLCWIDARRSILMPNGHLRVLTVKNRPDHHVIGQFYTGWTTGQQQIYYCDCWVQNAGYWMTNVRDPSDRRNISERAIDRTYHRLWADDPLTRNRLLYAEAVELFNRNVKHLVLDPYQGF
jgi:hypothetical protein